MGKVGVDVTKAKEFEELCNGDYDFVTGEARVLPAKEGKEYDTLMVPLIVVNGPEQDDGESPVDRRITFFVSMKPQSIFLRRALEACKVPFDRSGFDPADFEGKKVRGRIRQREYEGKLTANVRALFPLEKGGASKKKGKRGRPSNDDED